MPATDRNPRKCLRTSQFAAEFNLSPTTVRRLIETGEVRVIRIGRTVRIPVEEVDRLWRQYQATPAA